jgi:hypothetical protein
MWDDRFLFVTASLVAIALWISFGLKSQVIRDNNIHVNQ